jgi:septal ring factor EnvC (AmiA/AmiB activator)
MSDLDHHRNKLQASQDEVSRLDKLLSTKDSTIRELRASKKVVTQELEAAQLAIKTLENNCAVLKAQRDRAMDKAVRVGQILMRRPGVVVPDDIVADVRTTPDAASHPSSSVAPAKDAICRDTSAQ